MYQQSLCDQSKVRRHPALIHYRFVPNYIYKQDFPCCKGLDHSELFPGSEYRFRGMYTTAMNYVKMLAVVIILIAFFQAPKSSKTDSSRILIQVFVYYTLFILLRGTIMFNLPVNSGHEETSLYGIIRYFLVYEYSALSFFLIPFDIKEMSYYRPLAYLCTILCLINIFLFQSELFSFNTFGTTSIVIDNELLSIRQLIRICFIGLSAIVLFSYSLKNFKKAWFDYVPLIVIVLYGVAQVAGGGRGGSVTALVYFVFMLYFFLKSDTSKSNSSFMSYLVRFLIVAVIIYEAYNFMFLSGNSDFLFSRLFEGGIKSGEIRGENRGMFTGALTQDLNEHSWAWIIGKGANGSFMINGIPRGTIEWGFMYLILKGGILYLILYIALLLKSFYLGFFKSNNMFCKAMAVLCLICVYTLIPFGLPAVSLEFVLVWHYIRLINTNSVRLMTDSEIKRSINQKFNSRVQS